MKKELSMDMLLNQLHHDSLSNGEKAEILTTIIDLESEKPDGEADMDLIRECLDYLAFLNNGETEAGAERREERLERIYRKAADGEGSAKGKKRPVGRKRRFRKAAIVAAIIAGILLVAMTSLTVIARVNGYGNAWELISEHLDELFKLGNGEQMTINGVTVVINKDVETYPDIESWLKAKKWDMLYPSVFPDGIHLDLVNQTNQSEEEIQIAFSFDPPDMFFIAQNYNLSYFEVQEGMEIIEVNGYRVGILHKPELPFPYTAYLTVDGFSYRIGCQDRDTLLFMLEGLKKPGA